MTDITDIFKTKIDDRDFSGVFFIYSADKKMYNIRHISMADENCEGVTFFFSLDAYVQRT